MSQTITRQRSVSPDSSPHYQDSALGCRIKSTPSKIKRIQHSNVEQTYEILNMYKTAKQSARWCSINFLLALFFYFEFFQYLVSTLFSWEHHIFKYVDFTLVCIFSWNVVTNFYNYCLPAFRTPQMILTDQQKVLLGISKEKEKLFCLPNRTLTPMKAVRNQPTPPSIPLRKSPARSLSASSLLEYSPARQSPNATQQLSVQGQYSPGRNTTPSYSQVRFGTMPGTPDYSSYTGGSPLLNSPGTPLGTPSPSFRGSQSSPIRLTSSNDQMLDFEALKQFVKKEEETDLRNMRANPDSPKGPSFWSYGRAAYEYIPSFGPYQLATKSQSPSLKDDDDDSLDSPFKDDEMWKKIGLSKKDMDIWTENLRKWLAQTVLEPLVQEINSINGRLTQMGSPELHIGTTSHASLQTLATTKSQHLPSLVSLIPYLNMTTNQEYLVGRLKELSTGGCLRLHRWDSGGLYKGKAWNADLPADAQILIHLFCAYMDTHLPSNPRYPEGKSFSGLHFLKTPSKPSDRKSSLCLYQSRTQKPHFKVLVEDTVIEIPKGRHNLFHAILVFLSHVKRKHHGMLERVNLGMSGINILWVLEKK